jgi:hypothetical protein
VRRAARFSATASLSRNSQRWKLVSTKMIRNSTKAMAAATPHFCETKAYS